MLYHAACSRGAAAGMLTTLLRAADGCLRRLRSCRRRCCRASAPPRPATTRGSRGAARPRRGASTGRRKRLPSPLGVPPADAPGGSSTACALCPASSSTTYAPPAGWSECCAAIQREALELTHTCSSPSSSPVTSAAAARAQGRGSAKVVVACAVLAAIIGAVVAAGVQPAVAEPRGVRQGRTYAYEPSELLQLHQPIPVSVVLGEHLGRLGLAQVEPEVVQRGPQLAVVEVPAAVAVESLEARADRPVDWWVGRPPGAVR